MEKPLASSFGHIPALDGLRGIAILMVMVFHYQLPFADGGFYAVDIFFVLSGFLITGQILRERQQTGTINLWRFYVRRALRLFPSLVLLLLAFSLLLPLLPLPGLLLDLADIGDPNRPMNWLWILSLEIQFYIFWPPVLTIALRRQLSRHLILALPCLLALLFTVHRLWLINSGGPWHTIYSGSTSHSGGLFIGSALALFVAWWPSVCPHRLRILALASLAFMLALVFTQTDHSFLTQIVGFDLMALSASFVILYVSAQPSTIANVLSLRPLALIAAISYPLYLWHVPLHFGLLKALGFVFGHADTVLLDFTLSFLLAFLTYRYVEHPLSRLKPR